MADFMAGAIWTLASVLVGAIITLVAVEVLGDRGDPGPEDGGLDILDPSTPPVDCWRRELDAVDDWLWEDRGGYSYVDTSPGEWTDMSRRWFEANLLDRR